MKKTVAQVWRVIFHPFPYSFFVLLKVFYKIKGLISPAFEEVFYLWMDRNCSVFSKYLPWLFGGVTLADISHYTFFVLTL